MKRLLLLLAGCAAPLFALAQTPAGSVGIGTTAPNPAAALDIQAPDKGLLIPRLDSAARAAIGTPPNGLLVFQTNGRQGFWYALGGSWLYLPDKTKAGDNLGNHTLTRNLNLATFRLVGGSATAPGTNGLRIDGNGLVRLSTAIRPINTYDNGAGLHLFDADAGFLVRTTIGYGPSAPPISGSGDRLMWTSYFGSFRAGGIDADQWDASNMGFYSAAFGYNNLVSGLYSLGAGYDNEVRGGYATALGRNNYAGPTATASLVMGRQCRVSGSYTLAGGYLSKAQGYAALALGERCTANADYAIALGRYASAAGYSGTITLGDGSVNDSLRATANNQFSARYRGGYRLFTNTGMTVGVQVVAGGNAWTTISDSTKKERVVLADGNEFLKRINQMPLGSWNYKGQSPDTMRHYGPMAQDFYQAFGYDAVGRIGNDTTINQADFDGVNLIAIQALYRRVLALEAENAQLRRQVQQQPTPQQVQQAASATAALEERLRRLEAQLSPQAQR